MPRFLSLVVLTLALGASLHVGPLAAEPEAIAAQRAAFLEAYPAAESGQYAPAEERQELLEDYVLWPDLEAAYLRARLRAGKVDDARFRAYLDRYGQLRPAREIRYRYAIRLGRHNRHADYLSLYEPHYADSDDAVLDCFAAEALLATGRKPEARRLATKLWLTGSSQEKVCDPVFAEMRKRGWLTEDLLEERYALAIGAREFSLARYIARSLDEDRVADANRWILASSNPSAFLRSASAEPDSRGYRQQVAYATQRLAVRQPAAAWREWQRLESHFRFDESTELTVARTVALRATRRQVEGLDELLASLPPGAVDTDVLTWQARVGLGANDWPAVLAAIDRFDSETAKEPEWRYWRAVALEQLGRPAEAMLGFSVLARERNYYGFLAADAVGVDYAIETVDISADEAVLARLAARPQLLRAGELFRAGLDGRARSEWDEATRNLPNAEKIQAVLLAERWNWPSRAISLAARTGSYDSLESRYPLPHRELFDASAAGAGIPVSWAYGVARSESLFMRDIRSSAGAIGLMQLMPATGRRTASELKIPYRGLVTLTDPESNIRMGSRYLAKMKARFDGHPAVATAAYNAGPSRVSRWLPESGDVDARVWVETIPFRETRDYVRRVLTADVIFEWRLTGKTGRLSDRLPAVRSVGSAPALAD